MYPMVSLNASGLYRAIIIDNSRLPINDSITLQDTHHFPALHDIFELLPERFCNTLKHLRSAYYVFALFPLLSNLLHNGGIDLLRFQRIKFQLYFINQEKDTRKAVFHLGKALHTFPLDNIADGGPIVQLDICTNYHIRIRKRQSISVLYH